MTGRSIRESFLNIDDSSDAEATYFLPHVYESPARRRVTNSCGNSTRPPGGFNRMRMSTRRPSDEAPQAASGEVELLRLIEWLLDEMISTRQCAHPLRSGLPGRSVRPMSHRGRFGMRRSTQQERYIRRRIALHLQPHRSHQRQGVGVLDDAGTHAVVEPHLAVLEMVLEMDVHGRPGRGP